MSHISFVTSDTCKYDSLTQPIHFFTFISTCLITTFEQIKIKFSLKALKPQKIGNDSSEKRGIREDSNRIGDFFWPMRLICVLVSTVITHDGRASQGALTWITHLARCGHSQFHCSASAHTDYAARAERTTYITIFKCLLPGAAIA